MSNLAQSATAIAENAFVGRQPIFTRDLQTFAYELLFRSSRENSASITDGNKATASLLLNTFTEIGLERVVGQLPAFINIPREFLLAGHCLALPKDRVVLEVLEDIEPSPDVLAALGQLKAEGYAIALDDFVLSPELIPLVKLADIVKVELPAIEPSEWARHVEVLRQHDVKLLAEKVETQQEFDRCRQLGFDYFQGYHFCRPSIIEGKRAPANRVTMMRLVAKIQSPTASLQEVSGIVQTEPSLALRILRFVNSANNTLGRRVESIQHAVTMAGINRVKTIASMSALAEISGDKPLELIETVLIRAKMAELLAIATHRDNVASCFLAGLFSGLDALLDVPMHEAVEMVPLVDEVADALRDYSGAVGEILDCVIKYEQGNWEQVTLPDLDGADILDAWLNATEWVRASLAGM